MEEERKKEEARNEREERKKMKAADDESRRIARLYVPTPMHSGLNFKHWDTGTACALHAAFKLSVSHAPLGVGSTLEAQAQGACLALPLGTSVAIGLRVCCSLGGALGCAP